MRAHLMGALLVDLINMPWYWFPTSHALVRLKCSSSLASHWESQDSLDKYNSNQNTPKKVAGCLFAHLLYDFREDNHTQTHLGGFIAGKRGGIVIAEELLRVPEVLVVTKLLLRFLTFCKVLERLCGSGVVLEDVCEVDGWLACRHALGEARC